MLQDGQSRSKERIGTILSSAGIGGALSINGHSKPVLFYLKQPFQLNQVHLEKGTVLVQDSSKLRTLCEYSDFLLVSSQDGTASLLKPVDY